MVDWPRLLLFAGFFVILTVVVLEMVRRSRMSSLITPQQFRFRMAIAVLFLLEILMILAGTIFLAGIHPLLQIVFWTCCLLLALIILAGAVLDVSGVLRSYMIARRNILNAREDDQGDVP